MCLSLLPCHKLTKWKTNISHTSNILDHGDPTNEKATNAFSLGWGAINLSTSLKIGKDQMDSQ